MGWIPLSSGEAAVDHRARDAADRVLRRRALESGRKRHVASRFDNNAIDDYLLRDQAFEQRVVRF